LQGGSTPRSFRRHTPDQGSAATIGYDNHVHHGRPTDPQHFCSNCGARVQLRIPEGDSRQRVVCDACKTIHYRNPVVVAGAIPEWEDRILLCKRAIEPRYGTWTLPAGFMELGETTAAAAARETLEEANARVEITEAFSLLSVPYVSQVHVFYRARLLDLEFSPGTESLEVALFREEDIPWQELSFRTVITTLRQYFEDRRAGTWRFHAGEIAPHAP
jgi:ADP-ribose pyrophosphatase YjhB (NUDIX family)